jgi:predicted AlkP superfamily phosphohydrolase/phosphomutase
MAVLGLDGMTLEMARRLALEHGLDNLGRIALSGNAREIRAELPELSPVNWTSFYTARGPETHGIFGFTRIDPVSYETAVADATAVRCPSIFERLSERGLTSKVLNLPNTYPAGPIRGMLVAGFVAPELSRAVHPPILAAKLEEIGYRLEADTERGRLDHDLLMAELNAALDSRRAALDLLWPDLAWDLFVFVLTETDRLFHFLYPAVLDASEPMHAACVGFLQRLDNLVGEFLERFQALPEPKRLMVLADHGFTGLVSEVDLNAWLRRQGLLHLANSAGENDARGILPESKAFALDPGRIYLHRKKRFARGSLAEDEAESLRRELVGGLGGLRLEGLPVVRAVHDARQLYPGPCLDAAPDLVLEPEPGFDLKAKFDREEVFSLHGRRGAHTADGAIFYDSRGAAPQRIRDAGALVLDFFGLPVHHGPGPILQR